MITQPLPDLEERVRLLDAWVAKRREVAALEAQAAELLIERIAVHDSDVADSPYHRDAIYRSMVAEYSAAGSLPTGSVEFAFSDARTLALTLHDVRAAFASGAISVQHVREIVRASAIVTEAVQNRHVDPSVTHLFETAVLVVAETETAARTKVHARAVASALVGETILARHRRATDERCVTVKTLDDGLAVLTAVLPEWIAVAIADRLTTMSRRIIEARDTREPILEPSEPLDDELSIDLRDLDYDDPRRDSYESTGAIFADGTFTVDPHARLLDPLTDPLSPDIEHIASDARTLDQVRADLLSDLLLTAQPNAVTAKGIDGVTARVQVTIAASTLAGADDNLAELDGYGPLDPDVARGLAGRDTGWSRLFLSPKGLVTETDTYTPTEPMRRFLRARDQHCRFPGCRMPVHRCQIDHQHDHALGGRTRTDNLAHLCVRHHSLKHPDVGDDQRWTARQRADGSIHWTSPLGRAYDDSPRRRVMFVDVARPSDGAS